MDSWVSLGDRLLTVRTLVTEWEGFVDRMSRAGMPDAVGSYAAALTLRETVELWLGLVPVTFRASVTDQLAAADARFRSLTRDACEAEVAALLKRAFDSETSWWWGRVPPGVVIR